ncbi:DUF1631 family protein [Roseateles sp.]|uniref:DUF1631 family protein n=1 Tax=Roseateles sp. TaxID=1971397 RepID=UPI003BA69167
MADLAQYQAHCAFLLGRKSELAQQLVEQVQAALRASSADIAMAHDRNLLFLVSEAIQTNRAKFETALIAQIQAAMQTAGDTSQKSHKLDDMRLDQLTLVDEDQAEKEIEISRTVQLIDLTAEWELRELQAFSATLLGEPNLRPQANPFRPAIYAKGLSAAIRELPLGAGERNMLLRISGRALADLLRNHYAQACERLRQEGVSPLAFKAVTTPRKPRVSNVDVSQNGSLQSLLERLPASMQTARTYALQGAPAPLTFRHLPETSKSVPQPARQMPPMSGGGRMVPEAQVLALLNKLFDQMHADDDVQPAIKTMIGQLQPAVMRVARQDPEILNSAQHPAWRLINQLASYASGYADTDHTELNKFIQFIEPRIKQLVLTPGSTVEQFQNTLHDVQNFVEQQSQAQLLATPSAVTQLQEADKKLALRPILLQQVEHQIEGNRIKSSIKDFLLGSWVDVLTHAFAARKDDDETQAMATTVDDLIQSLHRPRTLEERDALKKSLPNLVNRLQRGMDSIALPQDKQEAILKELMGIHGHHLLAEPKYVAAAPLEPTAAELVQKMREEMAANRAAAHQVGHTAKTIDTNIGSLPTVPMNYGDEHPDHPHGNTPTEWTQSLRKGMWCKLYLQGQWTTAQLLWVSDNRQFFMFTSDWAGGMHSMTRRALERLRTEGLATNLEERSLMQRAVDSMLQDLDD